MGGLVWLVGMYGNEFVTVEAPYRTKIWKQLTLLRRSPLLEFQYSRERLIPYFFFLKPVENAKVLKSFDSGGYHLLNVAYEAVENVSEKGEIKRGGIRIPARGVVRGESFAVKDVPVEIIRTIENYKEKDGGVVCALALINTVLHAQEWINLVFQPKEDEDKLGIARTGTFFKCWVDGAGLRFMPLRHHNTNLSGKGILVGAWPERMKVMGVEYTNGGMHNREYSREEYCPLTIGGSVFQIKKNEKSEFYITFRGICTDIRMDMPAAFLFLRKKGMLRNFAKNFGVSINRTFGRCLGGIDQRNILADGNLIDYADINENRVGMYFDITKHENRIQQLRSDVFSLLYLCALVSACGEAAFEALKNRDAFVALIKKNCGKIKAEYATLLSEFQNSLKYKKKQYFTGLEDLDSCFKSLFSKGWRNKRELPLPIIPFQPTHTIHLLRQASKKQQ